MNKRIFKRLGLLILLLLILYHFFGNRHVPVPTGKLEEKPLTLPGVSEAPVTLPPLPAPIALPLELPAAPPGKGVGTSGTTPQR